MQFDQSHVLTFSDSDQNGRYALQYKSYCIYTCFHVARPLQNGYIYNFTSLFGSPLVYVQTAREAIPTFKYHGPVVQSIVSLTSSLRGQIVKCCMTYNQTH